MGARYTQLQPEERIPLASLHQQGWNIRASAKLIGSSPSTVSRELRCNCCEMGYASRRAQLACDRRRVASRPLPKLHANSVLWCVGCDLLSWRWSPQQIAATLRRMHPDESAWHLSHETIYNAIDAYHPRGELRKQLIALLHQGKSRHRPRLGRRQYRRGQIPQMVSIHVHPPEVNDWVMPGHWGGDLIKDAGNKSAVGVLVERSTRLALLCKMPDAGADAPDADLRSGQGDGTPQEVGQGHEHAGALLRSAQPLAERLVREHQ